MKSDEIIQFFSSYIERELGIQYSRENSFQLQNRLHEIAILLGEPSDEALYTRAMREGINGNFQRYLLDLATNNETSFFRDAKMFTALEETLFRPLKYGKDSCVLKIWSAASSSGQEALSLAMSLSEYAPGVPFEITATDVCDRVLERAEKGVYSQFEVQRGLKASLLTKYFIKDGRTENWMAKPELRKKIRYRKQNLLAPIGFDGPFDLILCRNVLIYQSVENKRAILARITALLRGGGVLVLGSGESLMGLSDAYLPLTVGGAILYQRKAVHSIAA